MLQLLKVEILCVQVEAACKSILTSNSPKQSNASLNARTHCFLIQCMGRTHDHFGA